MLTTLLLFAATPSFAGKSVCSTSHMSSIYSSDICVCSRTTATSDWRDPNDYLAAGDTTPYTYWVGETEYTRHTANLLASDCWNGTAGAAGLTRKQQVSAFPALISTGTFMKDTVYGLKGVWTWKTNPTSSDLFSMDAGTTDIDDTETMSAAPSGAPGHFDIVDENGNFVTTVIVPQGSEVTGAVKMTNEDGIEVIVFTIEDPFGGVDFWIIPVTDINPQFPVTEPPDDEEF